MPPENFISTFMSNFVNSQYCLGHFLPSKTSLLIYIWKPNPFTVKNCIMISKIRILFAVLLFSVTASLVSYAQTTNKKIFIMATDAVTGKPVANADITMKGLIFKQKRKTDFDGKASFDVYVISTALTVSFEIVDTSSSRTHKTYKSTLTLTAGRDNYDMNVSLEPNSKRIGLKLADNNSSPIVSAKLTLLGPSGNTLTAITDANGVANFDLPPGNA